MGVLYDVYPRAHPYISVYHLPPTERRYVPTMEYLSCVLDWCRGATRTNLADICCTGAYPTALV